MLSKFLLPLGLIFSLTAEAVTLPQASSYVQGGGSMTNSIGPTTSTPLANIDTAGWTLICGGTTSSTANNFLMFYSQTSPSSGAAQYQVPSGKVFYVTNVWLNAGTAGDTITLGYGTAALGSNDQPGSPTGAVYYTTASACVNGIWNVSTAATTQIFSPIGMQFPALSYPFWKACPATESIQACIQGIVK